LGGVFRGSIAVRLRIRPAARAASDELIAVRAEARSSTLDNQTPKSSPIPWHPGALKYLAEKGVKM